MKSVIWMAVLIGAAASAQDRPESTEGPALYKDYCASCHGANGKGFGPMSEWLKIKSPDLTRLTMREDGKFPLARVEHIILGEEHIATAGHGSREMPVWGPIFSQSSPDKDAARKRALSLAKFIETMQAKD